MPSGLVSGCASTRRPNSGSSRGPHFAKLRGCQVSESGPINVATRSQPGDPLALNSEMLAFQCRTPLWILDGLDGSLCNWASSSSRARLQFEVITFGPTTCTNRAAGDLPWLVAGLTQLS